MSVIHQGSQRRPDRGQISHVHLRDHGYARVSPLWGPPRSVKLRCTSVANKRENSPHPSHPYHVNRPYAMQLRKRFNNRITMEQRKK